MKVYNPKDWTKFLFAINKYDTIPQLLPMLIFVALYSGGVALWEIEYLHLSDKSWVKNIPLMHSLLGFVISLLLVFRTNTAYDRWWEGRKNWGTLTNISRNLSIKLSAILPNHDIENRSFFITTIALYATTLKDHLQAQETRFQLDDVDHPEFAHLSTQRHGPNQVAALLVNRVYKLHQEGLIPTEQLWILNQEITSFTDVCGACERIKNTPIPFSYSAFIKKFIFIYVLTLPFGYVFSLGYYVIPIVTFIFYVLASLELIAEQIEDPFGDDSNDLPMDKMSENVAKHIREILLPETQNTVTL
jgi:putative membrane protein